jgi:hypothetical protein
MVGKPLEPSPKLGRPKMSDENLPQKYGRFPSQSKIASRIQLLVAWKRFAADEANLTEFLNASGANVRPGQPS